MKKIITFLLIFLVGINVISAKETKSFACDYDLTFGSQDEQGIHEDFKYGKAQIKVDNYNSDKPTVTIFYENENGELVVYDGSVLDYKSNDESGRMLRFFTILSSKKYVESFKNNSEKCPELYVNPLNETIDVELTPVDPDNKFTFWLNKANRLLLSEDGEKWLTEEEFYKEEENVEIKKPRECPYTMEFHLIPGKQSIELVTNYDAKTGKESYIFKVNGNKTEFDTLDEDVIVMMGSGTGATVTISSSQLKKMYSSEECLGLDELFGYLDKELVMSGGYEVTTAEEEAIDNSFNGEYNQAGKPFPSTIAGNKNGVEIKKPSQTGFGNTGDECKQVLGPTLSAVVKEAIKWVRIFGGIIAIVNATLKLIPAIMLKDVEALNKALKTCVIMAIILVFCILFGWMLNLIGKLFKWDVTCIV